MWMIAVTDDDPPDERRWWLLDAGMGRTLLGVGPAGNPPAHVQALRQFGWPERMLPGATISLWAER